MRVRGLKLENVGGTILLITSHPMRVRGLKLENVGGTILLITSHPMRVRGLKLIRLMTFWKEFLVAPHAGAWIETLMRSMTD